MKKLILCFLVAGVAGAARAEKVIPMTFTITANILAQNVNVTTNKSVVTVGAPPKYSVTTSSLLRSLAYDEYLAGNYDRTNFPAGAKIVWLNYPDNFSASHFVVMDKGTNVLVDVSDFLKFDQAMNLMVSSGKYNQTNGLSSTWTEEYLGSLSFDDRNIGGGSQIYFGGLIKATLTDATPDKKTGNYTEKITATLTGGIGTGYYYGLNCIVQGTASASGSVKLNIND